jgi:hypothetical protein
LKRLYPAITRFDPGIVRNAKGLLLVKKCLPYRFLLLLLLVLLSCNLPSNILSTEKSIDDTPSPSETSAVATETDILQPSQPCPIPPGNPNPVQPTIFAEMPDLILQYLNAGGEDTDLTPILETAGMQSIESPVFFEEDFTGDGWNDLAFTLIDPAAETILQKGTLILNQCQGDQYQMVYRSPESPEWSAPTILSSDDMNSDGISDLIIGRQTCGAHTCFTRLEALLWCGDTLENRLQGSSEDMPYPDIEIRLQPPQISVIATGFGSIGAGPFRQYLRQWSWDAASEAFLPSPDQPLPSHFRIHVLFDADQAVEDGQLDRALDLYNQVIDDDELDDWIDPIAERAVLSAYASFRLIHTNLLLGDRDTAENIQHSLRDQTPVDSPGMGFVEMADTFWSEYENTGELDTACTAAQTYAISHQETTLDLLYFGYANPTYTAEDLCPILP